MIKNVRVSVIIPAYNAAPWLKVAVDSVLAQTLQDLEVIVVNDGSTDATSAIAHAMSDPRIRTIDQSNAGVSLARNTGIDHAIGEFITFLDADDSMEPENLKIKVDVLDDPDLDWVFGDLVLCDPSLEPTGSVMVGTDGDVVRTILLGRDTAVPGTCSNILSRRRCFEGGIRFDPTLSNAADQDMALQLANAFRYKRIPRALTRYRILDGSMSKNIELYEKDHERLMDKAIRTGLLDDPAFRRICVANSNWAIGGSWWVNGASKRRAIPFLLRAIAMRPSLLLRVFRRMGGNGTD